MGSSIGDTGASIKQDKGVHIPQDDLHRIKLVPESKQEASTSYFQLSSTAAFCIFLSVNVLAAIWAPVQDCDEVFNYWEPTHYLNHGFGLQTWEYSPEYAIRSWLYTAIHAVIGKAGMLPFINNHERRYEFYFIRIVLGCVCAGCEARLFSAISRTISPRLALNFMIPMVTASGMFHASVAYLPSSFAMYTIMMGMAAFIDMWGGMKTKAAIVWFGIGATIGWPFSAALVIPIFMGTLVFAWIVGRTKEITWELLVGGNTTLSIMLCQIAVDSFFYRKLVFVPWRIVTYNVFSGSSRGPDIFGTEPWHFYIRNLILNFNVWFLLAMCAAPILLLTALIHRPSTLRFPHWISLVFITPFYLWIAIFSAQPHKEERFMYPAYPLLCFNAAVTMHTLLLFFGSQDQDSIFRKISAKIRLFTVIIGVLLAIIVGVLRTLGTVTAYDAPLEIYKPLQNRTYADIGGSVCLGKEWYRFPSSYFLPQNMRVGFVKSAFDGLLPGNFGEAGGFGLPPTWQVPSGMNDQNIEDPGKHVIIPSRKIGQDRY